METNVILNNIVTLILSLIAMFAIIFSYVISNKKLAAVAECGSFLCVLATITYAILLGASLAEILIYVLVFVILSGISFIPKNNKAGKDSCYTDISDHKESYIEKLTEESTDTMEDKEGGNEL